MAFSNYADEKYEADNGVLDTPELRLTLDRTRRFDPDAGTEGGTSMLVDRSMGDWAWRPSPLHLTGRYKPMQTYKPKAHPRACKRCDLTSCLSLITVSPSACA